MDNLKNIKNSNDLKKVMENYVNQVIIVLYCDSTSISREAKKIFQTVSENKRFNQNIFCILDVDFFDSNTDALQKIQKPICEVYYNGNNMGKIRFTDKNDFEKKILSIINANSTNSTNSINSTSSVNRANNRVGTTSRTTSSGNDGELRDYAKSFLLKNAEINDRIKFDRLVSDHTYLENQIDLFLNKMKFQNINNNNNSNSTSNIDTTSYAAETSYDNNNNLFDIKNVSIKNTGINMGVSAEHMLDNFSLPNPAQVKFMIQYLIGLKEAGFLSEKMNSIMEDKSNSEIFNINSSNIGDKIITLDDGTKLINLGNGEYGVLKNNF
jgi:hypothetical protein